MEFLSAVVGDGHNWSGPKPKKDKKKKEYHAKAKADFFVNGFDDLDTCQGRGDLRDIEAGSTLNGLLVIRTPQVPSGPVLAKIVFQGRYHMKEAYHWTEKKTRENGETYTVHHTDWKSHDKKWLKAKNKIVVSPLPETFMQDHEGLFIIRYPFTYTIDPRYPDSFRKVIEHSKFGIHYYIKVKAKYPQDNIKVKSNKRPIDIMARRASGEEMTKKIPILSEKHSSLLGLQGSLEAAVTVDGYCFVEGTQALFTAKITNKMTKMLHKGTLKLKEHAIVSELHTNDHNDHERWEMEHRDEPIQQRELWGLEIGPGEEVVRQFSFDLPGKVEPPTCGFKNGHHFCAISHELKFHLEVPQGRDARIEFPVRLVVSPGRYRGSPPFNGMEQAVPAVVPEGYEKRGYAPLPFGPPPELPLGRSSEALMVRLVSCRDLPKMDCTFMGLRGACDPYLSVLLNGLAVQCSKKIDNTVNPDFNDFFTFNLTGMNPSEPIEHFSLTFTAYDYDRASADDKIGHARFDFGRGDLESRASPDQVISVPLTLEHPKKGTLERGTVQIQILGIVSRPF
uniref:C2 domain-containing protein n=1 Tax=Chromera velia CCMP2878 TaxID=1169474 RepID=A0A0G4FJP8_9ALVE|eukprot:Cvel_17234.t1-p1 / transcript=Cvel_17234.t1 / gene=Cvel_17234 / organism=Chromera_velia_CCMP2878 / gene_product=hypothetical protein / transcript_product=hypothetical protein / location=Cvel_scaffold1363:43924-45609(+) / protein_length=562 / sequence_SO=supercontig / SO=protein_coding / is_pseudo=false